MVYFPPVDTGTKKTGTSKFPPIDTQVVQDTTQENLGAVKGTTKIITDPLRNIFRGGKQFLKDVGEDIGVVPAQKPEDRGLFGRIQQGAKDLGKDIRQSYTESNASDLYGKQLPIQQAPVSSDFTKSPFYTEGEISGTQQIPETKPGEREPGFFSGNKVDDITERLVRTGFNTVGDIIGSGISTLSPDALKAPLNTPEGKKILQNVAGFVSDKVDQIAEKAHPNDPQGQREAKNALELVSYLLPLPGEKYIEQGASKLAKGFESSVPSDLIKGGIEKVSKPIKGAVETGIEKTKGLVPSAETLNKYSDELIYEAVNPTKLENKLVVQERANDLKPYLSDNPFKNDLEAVKSRIDTDMKKAGENMSNYEENVGVKGRLETDPIIVKLQDKYFDSVNGQLINPTEAKIAQELIDTLEGFGPVVTDADIIKVRRAWDKVEKANKGFMQSADANAKGEIFGDANKFFREEIHKSNPEYSQYLKDYHRTRTLSDVLEATINRRTGQTKGGFIRRGFENLARLGGITGGGAVGNPLLGWLGAEALIRGTEAISSPGFKLTIAKILANLKKNGIPDNIRVNPTDGVLPKQVGLVSVNLPVGQRIINAFKNGTLNAEDALAELMRKAQKGLVTPKELAKIAKENPELAQLMLKADKEETILEVVKSVENEIKLRPQRIEQFKEEIQKGIKAGQYTDEDLVFMIDNTKSPEIKKTIQDTIQEVEGKGKKEPKTEVKLKPKTEKKVKTKPKETTEVLTPESAQVKETPQVEGKTVEDQLRKDAIYTTKHSTNKGDNRLDLRLDTNMKDTVARIEKATGLKNGEGFVIEGMKPKNGIYNYVVDFTKDTGKKFSPDGAIKKYTNSSTEINKRLREGKIDGQIEALDEFLSQAKSEKGTVYRGMTLKDSEYDNFIEKIKKEGLTDKAYISSSRNLGDAITYARTSKTDGTKGVMLEIESKNGKIIDPKYNAYNEEEILFPRGSKFEYVGEYTDKQHGKIIELKEVSGKQSLPLSQKSEVKGIQFSDSAPDVKLNKENATFSLGKDVEVETKITPKISPETPKTPQVEGRTEFTNPIDGKVQDPMKIPKEYASWTTKQKNEYLDSLAKYNIEQGNLDLVDNVRLEKFGPKAKTTKPPLPLSQKSEVKYSDMSGQDALYLYTDQKYKEINSLLRRGDKNSMVDLIDKEIGKNKFSKDITLYRGVDKNNLGKLLKEGEGKTYTDNAFISTSASPKIAQNFSDGYILEIKNTKGLNYAENPSSVKEMEYILPRGTKFDVIGKRKEGNTTVIILSPAK